MLLSYLPTSIKVNGINLELIINKTYSFAKKEAQIKRKKFRTVKVLNKNLHGKLDFHGNFYKPFVYLFVEV